MKEPRWKWPFKVVATVPVVWLLVQGAHAGEGGVLGDLGTLGAPLAAAASATQTAASGTVLITGASRGIGFELARQYAEAGWTVIATARKPRESAGLVELAARHSGVRLEALDVVDGAIWYFDYQGVARWKNDRWEIIAIPEDLWQRPT